MHVLTSVSERDARARQESKLDLKNDLKKSYIAPFRSSNLRIPPQAVHIFGFENYMYSNDDVGSGGLAAIASLYKNSHE